MLSRAGYWKEGQVVGCEKSIRCLLITDDMRPEPRERLTAAVGARASGQ